MRAPETSFDKACREADERRNNLRVVKLNGGEFNDIAFSDIALAKTFADENERRLRFVPLMGKWFVGGKTRNPYKPLAVILRKSSACAAKAFTRNGVQPRTSSFWIRAFIGPTCSPTASAQSFQDRKSSACAAKAFTSR